MKEGWEYKKLGEVCCSDLGKTLNKSKDKGKPYPYLCAINIQWDAIDLSNLKSALFEEDEIEKYSVVQGDLLVCEGGDIGRSAIWNEPYPMLYQNALHRIRFNENMNARFCMFYLCFLKNNNILDTRYGKGVTIKHLVKSALLSIPIPLPPLTQQQSIVAELDKINEIIDLKKAQLKDLDLLAQSIFYDMFGDPIENSKGWEVKKVIDVVTLQRGFDLPTNKRVKNGNIPVYGSNGILDYHNESKLDKGIITGRSGTIGKVFVSEKPFWPLNTTLFSKDTHGNNIVYLCYLLQFFDLNRFVEGAGVPTLNRNNFHGKNIISPPLSLQQSFAEKIQSIESQKSAIKQSLAEAETLLASRMDYYFN